MIAATSPDPIVSVDYAPGLLSGDSAMAIDRPSLGMTTQVLPVHFAEAGGPGPRLVPPLPG
jgi:hypothetical protein